MAVRRRRQQVSTSAKLLATDFPRWKSALQRSASTLDADSLQRFRQLQDHSRQARGIERQALAPIVDLIRDRPQSERARRQSLALIKKATATRVRDPGALAPVQPGVTEGSLLQVFGPPYDGVWTKSSPNANSCHPSADAIQGTFGAWGEGHGESIFGGAGIGVGFHALSNLPMAHVRPYFRYSYHWSNYSFLETAHTSAFLKIRAIQFGPSGQQTKSPPDDVSHQLWSDGTSWFQTHKDEGEDVWPGTVQLDFPLVAGQFYAIWIYCQVFADDAGTLAMSHSSAFASLKVRVPFFVIEESQA